MKTLKKQIKSIAQILSMLILLQGCTVYKSAPISLDQAVHSESKVKVRTLNNEKLKFNRIEVEDGNYFGIKVGNGEIFKRPLDQNSIESIKGKDKTLSTVLSIGIPLVVVGGAAAIAAASCCSVDLSGANWGY